MSVETDMRYIDGMRQLVQSKGLPDVATLGQAWRALPTLLDIAERLRAEAVHHGEALTIEVDAHAATRAEVERLTGEALPCGHPASLALRSVESSTVLCELCEARSAARDAETMEAALQERVRTLEEALRQSCPPECSHEGCDAKAEVAMSDKNGGPAFPMPAEYRPSASEFVTAPSGGMSLRDYFAAQALGSTMTHALTLEREPDAEGTWDPDSFARSAYEVADAMLAARAEEPKP